MKTVLLDLLVLLTVATSVSSFSSGTGSCFGSSSNILGPHLQSFGLVSPLIIQTGSLADGGLSLVLDNDVVPDDELFFFSESRDFSLRVEGLREYRGIFIRLEADPDTVDTTAALVESTGLLQPANVCSNPVVGIVHNSAVLKNNVGGTLRINEIDANVALDVTIVEALNETHSVYFYSRYSLSTQAAPSGSPSFTPTDTPSGSPSSSPSAAPSPMPSSSPTSSPSEIPTQIPTDQPSPAPTTRPTSVPTVAPTDGPTNSPTVAPTDGPTRLPTLSPTDGPTPLPTSFPTRGPTNQPSLKPTTDPTNSPTSEPTNPPTTSPSRSLEPSAICSQEGDVCILSEACCGTNVCVGICTRIIPPNVKDQSKNQFKLAGDTRVRGSAEQDVNLGRIRGSARLLKGSGPEKKKGLSTA